MIHIADLAHKLKLQTRRDDYAGDCPACGYARAFTLKETQGRILVWCANGCTQRNLRAALMRATGESWKMPVQNKENQDEAAKRERATAAALRIWNGSENATGTLADTYLTNRALPGLAASTALRFRGDCDHPAGGRYPALVALVVDISGNPTGVHRTYLAHDGRKAAIDPCKAAKGPIWKNAIRLDDAAPEIVIGEGLETAASAGRILGLPAWSAVSAGNLKSALILPDIVRAVVIAADEDKAGIEAAHGAAQRWRAEGRRVRIARPDKPKTDFNDIIAQRMEAANAA